MKKIGIFSGVFDPVHDGHINFALVAARQASLDEVYFLVEPKPRRKTDVSHFAHRIAMVKLAIQNYSSLKILEIPDKQFSVAKTLPRLKHKFAKAGLYYICGSDMLEHMPDWPLVERMLEEMNLIVGIRGKTANNTVKVLKELKANAIVIESPNSNLSSQKIRNQITKNLKPKDISPEVYRYIKHHWLYVSVSASKSSSSS